MVQVVKVCNVYSHTYSIEKKAAQPEKLVDNKLKVPPSESKLPSASDAKWLLLICRAQAKQPGSEVETVRCHELALADLPKQLCAVHLQNCSEGARTCFSM